MFIQFRGVAPVWGTAQKDLNLTFYLVIILWIPSKTNHLRVMTSELKTHGHWNMSNRISEHELRILGLK